MQVITETVESVKEKSRWLQMKIAAKRAGRRGWKSFGRYVTQHPRFARSLAALPVVLIGFVAIKGLPSWSRGFAKLSIWSIPSSEVVLFASLLGMYILGGVIADFSRYGVRLYAAPLLAAAAALLVLTTALVYPTTEDLRLLGSKLLASPSIIIALLILVLFRKQVLGLVPRIRKAELAGAKVEIGDIEEMQKKLNPWKKTITGFGELMDWVSDLISETSPEDRVRFLAYTPALGFLTRGKSEWERLERLLKEKPNIQIICLPRRELTLWHLKFLDKPTKRPGGKIDKKLIKQAQWVSESILSEKTRYTDADDPMAAVKRRSWRELPGYYLFANSKRAIIAIPFFLPGDPRKCSDKSPAANSNNMETTPVEMLGFESTDSWTVWLVNQLCDRYARDPVKMKRAVEFRKPFKIQDLQMEKGIYHASFDGRTGWLSLEKISGRVDKSIVRGMEGKTIKKYRLIKAHSEQRDARPRALDLCFNDDELVSITFKGSDVRIVIDQDTTERAPIEEATTMEVERQTASGEDPVSTTTAKPPAQEPSAVTPSPTAINEPLVVVVNPPTIEPEAVISMLVDTHSSPLPELVVSAVNPTIAEVEVLDVAPAIRTIDLPEIKADNSNGEGATPKGTQLDKSNGSSNEPLD